MVFPEAMEPLHLAIDTSTARPVVALMQGLELRAEWTGPAGTMHSETLLAGIDQCVKSAQANLKDLQFISCGTGPGMFTGLRVGVATAQFLADSLKIQVAPVSSLLALALGARSLAGFSRVWALNDAKSGRIYALSLLPNEIDPSLPPRPTDEVAYEPKALSQELKDGDILIGEGAVLYRELWPEQTREVLLKARDVGEIGFSIFQSNGLIDPLKLLPRYLKTSEEGQKHL